MKQEIKKNICIEEEACNWDKDSIDFNDMDFETIEKALSLLYETKQQIDELIELVEQIKTKKQEE